MTIQPENRPLILAIAASVLAHAALLAIRFVPPDAFRLEASDPGLEVILVNAKHANKPLKAEALAQANLDGGGMAEAGRAKSPLPDMRRMEMGESMKAVQRRVQELEAQQRNLLSKVQASKLNVAPLTEQKKPDPKPTGADLIDSARAIARMTAEITQTIEDQNKRPRKTFISPSTREVGYAMYYKTMQKRIEDLGTLNFPQQDGRKLYGELELSIPIFQDGSIYKRDGGVKVEKSSGNAALDRKAVAIVERAAPFGRFPPNMLSADRDDLWVIITRFRFTREEKMQAEFTGEDN